MNPHLTMIGVEALNVTHDVKPRIPGEAQSMGLGPRRQVSNG